jgi:hypothetical protein
VSRNLVRGLRRKMRVAGYRLGEGLLKRLGYDVQIARSWEGEAAETRELEEREFYREWRTATEMWTPWLADEGFKATYDGVAPHTVVSPDRCYVLYNQARQALNVEGEFAECGVFNGGTALFLSRIARSGGKKLNLFDSFEGLPAPDAEKDLGLEEGLFKSASAEAVERLVGAEGVELEMHVGFMPGTFAGLEERRFAFVHIDVDLYQSTLDCCRFFYPRLQPGGMMVFDDHGFPGCQGQRLAVAEFFGSRPEEPLALPTGQAVVVKLP